MRIVIFGLIAAVATALPCPVSACVLCGNLKNRSTLRENLSAAKIVLYGKIANPRLPPGARRGTTELHVLRAVKVHSGLKVPKVVVMNRYVPLLNKENPPRYLVFCDVIGGKLNVYHGLSLRSKAMLQYLDEVQHLRGKSRAKALEFYFGRLSHIDPEIAGDAFLEFAKSSDADVGRIARKVPAATIRALLTNKETPAERLGLFGFILGAAGQERDAALLRSLINDKSKRSRDALDGLLSGYIQLKPNAGWEKVNSILRDRKSGFLKRYAAARVLTFYHNWKPKENRPRILKALGIMLEQPDIADLALNNMRRWKMWDLTKQILACYGKKDYASPITRRAILRYAVTCPHRAAIRFVDEQQRADPELIGEIKESLAFEK